MANNSFYLQLRQLIQSCDGSDDNIASITRFCLQNRQSNDERIQITCFEDFLSGSRLIETKITAVKIMTHILLEDSQKKFLRAFSQRFLSFFEKEKYEIRQSEDAIRGFIDILTVWQARRVFCDKFVCRLKEKAGRDLMDKVKKQIDSSHFKKYSKSFLMMYRDIQMVPLTKRLYALHCKRKQAQASYSTLQPQIGSKESLAQTSNLIKAQQLLCRTNNMIEEFSSLIRRLMENGEQIRLTFQSNIEKNSLKEADLRGDEETAHI